MYRVFWLSRLMCFSVLYLFSFFLLQIRLHSQTDDVILQHDKPEIFESNFSLGIPMGYSGLNTGSPISKTALGNDFSNGFSLGIFIEYKIDDSPFAVQLMSEFHEFGINFSERANKNKHLYNTNTIGFKYQPEFLGKFYVLPAIGFMVFDGLQLLGAMSVGYEFTSTSSQRTSYFYQLGYAFAENKDRILMFRLGLRYKL